MNNDVEMENTSLRFPFLSILCKVIHKLIPVKPQKIIKSYNGHKDNG